MTHTEKLNTVYKLLARKNIGVIIRCFTNNPTDFMSREGQVLDLIHKLDRIDQEISKALDFGGGRCINRLFKSFDVLVWNDHRYSEASSNLLYTQLSRTLSASYGSDNRNTKLAQINSHNFCHGDLYCGILNYGIATQLRDGIDYSLIISSEALDYLNADTILEMFAAIACGAKVSGVAINELTQSVLEGRLANTFCLWDNIALMSVGGFDLRAAKPIDEKSASYMKGWDQEKGEVYYQLAGVEEIIPLLRLVDHYGKCLKPILPQGEGVKQYQMPDPKTQPELFARHIAKFGTKLERQTALANSVGYELSFLKSGLMQ